MAKQPLILTQAEKDMVLSGLISVVASAERKAADDKSPLNIKTLWKQVSGDAEKLANRIDAEA